MRSHLKPIPWLVIALAFILVGASASTRAQSLPANPAGGPQLGQASQDAAPDLKFEALDSTAPSVTSRNGLFNAVNAAFIITAGSDLSVSMYQVGRGAAREAAFGAQWQDSPVAFAVTKSAVTAAFVYGLQRLHKDRPKTAVIVGVVATAVEGWLTVRSARISPAQP